MLPVSSTILCSPEWVLLNLTEQIICAAFPSQLPERLGVIRTQAPPNLAYLLCLPTFLCLSQPAFTLTDPECRLALLELGLGPG